MATEALIHPLACEIAYGTEAAVKRKKNKENLRMINNFFITVLLD